MNVLYPGSGPKPDSVKCDNSEINDFCNSFQSEGWLATCDDKVDEGFKEDLKKACVIDLCANNADSTKPRILNQEYPKFNLMGKNGSIP